MKEQEKKFLEWYALTPKMRKESKLPKDMWEYSEVNKIPFETLIAWAEPKKEDELDEDEIFIESIKNLRKIAQKSPKANELLLKAFGRLVDKQETKVEHSFEASEYVEIAREVLERVAELIPQECRGSCPLLSQQNLFPKKLRQGELRGAGSGSVQRPVSRGNGTGRGVEVSVVDYPEGTSDIHDVDDGG